jgi:hypothetical protein
MSDKYVMDGRVIERIQSKLLKNESLELRSEIIADTTPVPVFGNFRDSEIVSIALNPSSNEFPANESNRRLLHLSDLDISPQYYQHGMDSMSEIQAAKILEKCVNYFEGNSYKWFNTASVALKIGFGASYYKNDKTDVRACHTDIFPWATRAFSTLSSDLQLKFKEENQDFLSWFLQRDQVTNLVILGSSTWREIENVIKFNPIHKETADMQIPPTFEYGTFEIGGSHKPYFYSSKGPSARGSDAEKLKIHELFGNFIKSAQKI